MSFKAIINVLCAVLVAGCAAPGGVRIDNIAMYGQPEIERPEILKKADEDFIKDVSKKIPDRTEASRIWHAQAEAFMEQGNLDYAMRRYNQAWLLDPNNYQPYWGFARVSLALGNPDEAIEQIEKAKELVDDSFQEVALLADAGTVYAAKALSASETEKANYFSLANKNFESSIALDQSYADSWRRWAYSLYEQGRYSDAAKAVEKAKQLGSLPFNEAFLEALSQKLEQLGPLP